MAEKSELSLAYISKLKEGEYKTFPLKTCKQLANGLSLSLREFLEKIGYLTKEEKQESPTLNLVEYNLISNGLSRQQVEKVVDYAKLIQRAENNK